MTETQADTCRRHVVPALQAAGWDTAPHSIAEQRTITDGRIVPVGRGFVRKPPKRVDFLLRCRRDFPLAVVEAKASYRRLPAHHRQCPARSHGRRGPPCDARWASSSMPHIRNSASDPLAKGTFHKPALSGAEVGTKRLFEVHAGDLLFSNVFAWEGAVAVAQPADHGRFGLHRFITRRVDPDRATTEFRCSWFLTSEGLQALGEASPGGAGRNRTLGLEALDCIQVPLPPLDAQLWFDRLQQKARAARAAQAAAAEELDRLLPSLLAEAFG
ncbi:MAG: hypothetical protein NZ773_16010, partial [Dehalococcoidia bacterium]|nr:hypothetical protein [Dehalococcoidia bacterium]